MKKYYIISVMLLLFSCDTWYDEIDKTVFIPDEKDENLPKYTEWGYNSFGTVYERMYFYASSDIVPCKAIYQNGKLRISISGRLGLSRNSGNERLILSFSFPIDEPMRDYWDLMALHQKKIDLSDSSCEVAVSKNSETEVVFVQSGQLSFNRAQLVRIDEKESHVILSGTFDMIFWRNMIPETMSNGRFDFGISNLFFYPD